MRTIGLLGWFFLCLVGVAVAAGANDPPVAEHDFPAPVHNNGEHFFDVLANDHDPDPGDVIVLSGPIDDPDHPLNDHAMVTKDGSRIQYEAHAGFVGIDTFRYRINDGQKFHSAIVTVEVTANRAPIAVDDEATMVAGPMQSILIDVLQGDSDPDGDPLALGGPVEDPAHPPADHATVVLEGSRFRYTPHPGFVGEDTFRYRISDGALVDSAVVTVVVQDPDGSPGIRITGPAGEELTHGAIYPFDATPLDVTLLDFEVHNDGGATLVLDDPEAVVSGSGFSLATPPAPAVLSGESTSLRVRVEAGSSGSLDGTLAISSNAEPSPYTVSLQADVSLPGCGGGPGPYREAIAQVIRGLPPTCDGTDMYNVAFPTVYTNPQGHVKCGYNVPVLAGTYTLITDPGRSGPNGGDVLDWWFEYLAGELGMRGPAWHFGALEAFSGAYQWENEVAVIAARFESLRRASDPQVPAAQRARYAKLADLAGIWLRATFTIQAAASTPVPDEVYDWRDDEFVGAPGTDVFDGNVVPKRYVALAGERSRDETWKRQHRSFILERALRTSPSRYSREDEFARIILDYVQGQWPFLSAREIYGLSGAQASALAGIQGNGELPGFLAGMLSGTVDVGPFTLGGEAGNQPWRITTARPYELIGWGQGDRLSAYFGRLNPCKPPTSGMFYSKTGDGPLEEANVLYALYPFDPDPASPGGTPTVSLDLAEGSFQATANGRTDRVTGLPPTCGLGFEIRFYPADDPVVQPLTPACPSGGTACAPPGTAALLGHWNFEPAASFDGASFLPVPAPGDDLAARSEVTVTAWVEVPLHSQPNVFRASQPVALSSDRFSVANFVTGGGWSTVVAHPPPPVGSRYHLAGVFDHGELRIYVDGQLAGTAVTGSTETGSGSTDWSIGARSVGGAGPDQFFVGEIDEVRVYSRVLTDQEIAFDAGVCP